MSQWGDSGRKKMQRGRERSPGEMQTKSIQRHHSSPPISCTQIPATHANAAPSANATPVSVIAILARQLAGDHSRRCESETGTMEPTPIPVKNLAIAKTHTLVASAEATPKTQNSSETPIMHSRRPYMSARKPPMRLPTSRPAKTVEPMIAKVPSLSPHSFERGLRMRLMTVISMPSAATSSEAIRNILSWYSPTPACSR
mmetsp:Transcript_25651/g.60852  ORF Transcript_25651/g.60852 Transcript_25651/m.60852 type:complete len:200 (+) Transcript_25651:915-1514(+)